MLIIGEIIAMDRRGPGYAPGALLTVSMRARQIRGAALVVDDLSGWPHDSLWGNNPVAARNPAGRLGGQSAPRNRSTSVWSPLRCIMS